MKFTRFWWGLGWVLVLTALVVCLLPEDGIPSELDAFDKWTHLLGHGGLAIYFSSLVPRQRWWKIFVFLLAFGISIEFIQYAMQLGRQADVRDVIANSAGAGLGLLLARFGLERWAEIVERLLGQRRTVP